MPARNSTAYRSLAMPQCVPSAAPSGGLLCYPVRCWVKLTSLGPAAACTLETDQPALLIGLTFQLCICTPSPPPVIPPPAPMASPPPVQPSPPPPVRQPASPRAPVTAFPARPPRPTHEASDDLRKAGAPAALPKLVDGIIPGPFLAAQIAAIAAATETPAAQN